MAILKGQTLLNCPTSGQIYLKWKDARVPPAVKVGKYITVCGKLITLDLGRSFLMVRGELLRPSSLNNIKKYISVQR
jgi:hypothetical protein